MSKSKMISCRTRCTKDIREQKKLEAQRKEADRLANEMRLQVESIHDIPGYITEIVKKRLDREIIFTDWDLKFKELSPTHDAPIGKNTEWGNVKNKYLGWEGQVKGTTNLSSKPVEFPSATFGKISSPFDIFARSGRGLIRGIHSGGGSGGDQFGFIIRIYLDDYPKIKAKYEEFLPLKRASELYNKERSRRKEQARIEVIDTNPEILELQDAVKILNALKYKAEKRFENIKRQLYASKEFAEASKVPDSFNFDHNRYNELSSIFT